jgi:pimeloyl-ACP methyl ester carboxylesterase
MAEILANGVRLHVECVTPHGGSSPDAPVVVALHGLIVDNLSSFYLRLANNLARDGADVICYDQRGHGRSELTPSGYTIANSIADLIGVLDALELDGPVHLVGNSYGATIALSCGLAYPDRVASLVLIEHPFRIEGFGEFATQTLSDMQQWLDRNPGRVAARQMRTAKTLMNETTLDADLLATAPFPPERLRDLSMPVMAVYGSHSELVELGQEFVRCIPRCTLVVLEHHTHFVLHEATEYMRKLVGWWLFARDHQPMPSYAPPAADEFSNPEWFTIPALTDRIG